MEDKIGFVSVVDRMEQNTALKVVNSARISYAKKKDQLGKQDLALTKYLWNNEHTSPFRHTYYTFHLKQPLFVFRQFIKYQVGGAWRTYEIDGYELSLEIFDLLYDTDKGCSWNEVSGRYVILKPEFYIPYKIRGNTTHGSKQKSTVLPESFNHDSIKLKIMDHCEETYKLYEELIESGVAKELARSVLPQNIYTESYWTVSLQGVLHFLTQRLHETAQYEIQCAAKAIYSLLRKDLDELGIDKESFKL